MRGTSRNAAGVEQHDLSTENREGVFNLEVVKEVVLRQNFRHQVSQSRDVPLAVAQVVQEVALCFLLRDVKRLVEGTVRHPHPQLAVENQERLSQGRDDVVRVSECLLQCLARLPAFSAVLLRVHARPAAMVTHCTTLPQSNKPFGNGYYFSKRCQVVPRDRGWPGTCRLLQLGGAPAAQ